MRVAQGRVEAWRGWEATSKTANECWQGTTVGLLQGEGKAVGSVKSGRDSENRSVRRERRPKGGGSGR